MDQGPNTRPSWALDGSFLAFRYLFQLVPEFQTFLKRNPIAGLAPDLGSELLGARFVGRWMSGMLACAFFASLVAYANGGDGAQEHLSILHQRMMTRPSGKTPLATTTSAMLFQTTQRRKIDAPSQRTHVRQTLEPTLRISTQLPRTLTRNTVSFVAVSSSDQKLLQLKLHPERLSTGVASSSQHTRATFTSGSNFCKTVTYHPYKSLLAIR